jgi:hypothetical protein
MSKDITTYLRGSIQNQNPTPNRENQNIGASLKMTSPSRVEESILSPEIQEALKKPILNLKKEFQIFKRQQPHTKKQAKAQAKRDKKRAKRASMDL